MIPMRPHNASHSSMECVVRMTDRPCMVLEISIHMKRRDSGSTPVVGSSKKMHRGSPIKAMPSDSFLRVPPEKVLACLSAYGLRVSLSSMDST
mmetsp:Transcript_68205/g.152821  ORF Transcript_68205/g.152821 Transcript_68205/m.152821 type:complete len:93 (-) Transcript_68205:71-349(-)